MIKCDWCNTFTDGTDLKEPLSPNKKASWLCDRCAIDFDDIEKECSE